MGKKGEWQNKNVNLKMLAETISTFLRNDDFTEVGLFEDPNGVTWEIKARKTGIGLFLTSRMKTFEVIIEGAPNNFKVSFERNVGRQYLTQGVLGVGLNTAYQAKLMKFIESTVEKLENTATNMPNIRDQAIQPYQITDTPMESKKMSFEDYEQNYLNRLNQEGNDQSSDPVEILKMRLAKGEIDQKQYKQLLKILQSSQAHANSTPSSMHDSGKTQFWSCPHCYGPIEIQNGKEYCRVCNKYMDSS